MTRGIERNWEAIQDKEYIKLLIADVRRARNDIELHTVNYNPLNPDAALDEIYKLAKQMERSLNTLYEIYLEAWVEAVVEARHGQEFEGEEAADIEKQRNAIRTRLMGDSTTTRDGRARWRNRNKH